MPRLQVNKSLWKLHERCAIWTGSFNLKFIVYIFIVEISQKLHWLNNLAPSVTKILHTKPLSPRHVVWELHCLAKQPSMKLSELLSQQERWFVSWWKNATFVVDILKFHNRMVLRYHGTHPLYKTENVCMISTSLQCKLEGRAIHRHSHALFFFCEYSYTCGLWGLE